MSTGELAQGPHCKMPGIKPFKDWRWLQMPREKMLFKFKSEQDLLKWRLGSDADFGGNSTGNWGLSDSGTGIFWGTLAKTSDLNYAALKSKEEKWSILHKTTIDASDFKNLLVRAKIPKGKISKNWRITLKTQSFYATHVYSLPLNFTKFGEFEILEFKFRHFKITDSSKAQGLEMDRSKIKSVGFTISSKTDLAGDFSLEIDWIMLLNKGY